MSSMSSLQDWYRVSNPEEIDSPALLLYEDRIDENLRRMVEQAGGVDRLRPHIKTHKIPEILQKHLALGISRFKVATIAEAEMCACAGALDVLLAYPPVGPRAGRLALLARKFPKVRFSVALDDASVAEGLSRVAFQCGVTLGALLDIDCGQHRTGIAPGPEAVELYQLFARLPGLRPEGIHVYDGHIHDSDVALRGQRCEEAFQPVAALREQLELAGLRVPTVVAGGTPTFPFHARRPHIECSPGTCVFWDQGYATHFPDLDYLPAAVLLTRVISKPLSNRLCLDLGHKAVASEMPQPRVHLLNLPDAVFVGHNEEHLMIETDRAGDFPIGSVLYALPTHVCPTVALHSEVAVIRNGHASARWRVVARDRRLTV